MLPGRGKTWGKELETARQLIDALSIERHPEDYHDTYEERVKELVDAKAEGKEIASEEGPPQATNVTDLMDILQRSVEQSRKGHKPPSAGQGKAERLPAGERKQGSRKQEKAGKGATAQLEQLSKGELYMSRRLSWTSPAGPR